MKIKLLQWNIWMEEKIENIYEYIHEIDPDICCLQELFINYEANPNMNTFTYLQKKLAYQGVYVRAHKHQLNVEQGNAIFSKFPITNSKSHVLQQPDDTNNYSQQGRVYLESELLISDSTLLAVGTTHLSYVHEFRESETKLVEERNLMREVESARLPYIFAGDLNAGPDSSIVKQLSSQLTYAGPDSDQNTWTTKPFNYNGFQETGLNWRLDHVFTSQDIKVINAKILSTAYSDHLPIYIEFEVN